MKIIPLPALKDNYIWTMIDNQQAIIVDPGEAAPVLSYLQENNLQLIGIFITHHHGDHTHGLEEILNTVGNIPVYGSYKSQITFINHPVKEGDKITCGFFQCRAIEIPGHTLDHTAYYSNKDKLVFTGDTLFSAGCGRVFEGDPEMMFASLGKLKALPDDTKVYCGHEYTKANLQFAELAEPDNAAVKAKLASLPQGCTLPSTIGDEKSFNPFLRAPSAKVFASLREWKNNL